MDISVKDLIDAIAKYKRYLKAPAAIDAGQLLWALSGNESSFGKNIAPRHEAAYCPIAVDGKPGDYSKDKAIQNLTAEYGCLAHCSYGAMQVMLCNCITPAGIVLTPLQMLSSPDSQVLAAIGHLNRVVFGEEQAATIEEVGEAYNAGNWKKFNAPTDYAKKLLANYQVPMAAL